MSHLTPLPFSIFTGELMGYVTYSKVVEKTSLDSNYHNNDSDDSKHFLKSTLFHLILTIPLTEVVPIIILDLLMKKWRHQKVCQNTWKNLKCYASLGNDGRGSTNVTKGKSHPKIGPGFLIHKIRLNSSRYIQNFKSKHKSLE